IEERAHHVVRALAARMLVSPERRLMHFDRGEGPRVADLLGDWAAFLQAALDEYETGKHRGALAGAVDAATAMRERLEDTADGGFFDAPERAEPGRVALREKPIEDNAMAADALLRLATLTGDEQWRETAVRTLRSFVGTYRAWGQFASSYANAVARALAEPLAISVVGPKDDATAMALWSGSRTPPRAPTRERSPERSPSSASSPAARLHARRSAPWSVRVSRPIASASWPTTFATRARWRDPSARRALSSARCSACS